MVLFARSTLIAISFIAVLLAPLSLEASKHRTPVLVQPYNVLQTRLNELARGINSGTLGISVLDAQSGTQWRINSDNAYPMMSVFKVPLAAVVLERIDQGRVSLQQQITITRAELRGGVSAINNNFHGDRMTFTVQQLLHKSVSLSDNTATDALIKLIGGPASVTAFLRSHGIEGMRVDLDEEGVSDLLTGRRSGEPLSANETPQARDSRLRSGLRSFLADPRNRSTPDAAVIFLKKLQDEVLLSPSSTRYLLDLMQAQMMPSRLRNGLPAGVTLADKCGTSTRLHGITAAYNDVGIMTWPDGRSVIVVVFLTASKATQAEHDRLFSTIARAIGEAAQQ